MSQLWNLTKNDWVKGLIVTVLGAIISLLSETMKNGGAIDWKSVGITALVAGSAYVVKQLGTDQNGKFLGKI